MICSVFTIKGKLVMEEKLLFKDLSYKIVGLAMQVHNELGYGFLEKVYENALMVLFAEHGIRAVQQAQINIDFHGNNIGIFYADILVEDVIILELKSQEKLIDVNKAQALNYLKASRLRLAILLNFAKTKLENERIVL